MPYSNFKEVTNKYHFLWCIQNTDDKWIRTKDFIKYFEIFFVIQPKESYIGRSFLYFSMCKIKAKQSDHKWA